MKTITVWNMKGGVGKTTFAFQLATEIARRGEKVLCIDLDTQANFTSYFESGKRNKQRKESISTLAFRGFTHIDKAIYRTKYQNIDYISGSNSLIVSEDICALQKALSFVEDKYAFTIIDCHPDFSSVSQMALYAAEMILVPICLDTFCRDNLNLVKNFFMMINDIKENNLETTNEYYVVANRVQNRKVQKEVYKDLIERHQYPLLDICISESAAVASSNILHKPLYAHRKNATVTKDFSDLCKFVCSASGKAVK